MAVPASVLKGSVGFGGRNQRSDVQLVQALLNAVPASRGGAAPGLATDGICGSMTNGAIKRFQAANQCYADSRIDAGGKTERTLLDLLDQLGKLLALLPERMQLMAQSSMETRSQATPLEVESAQRRLLILIREDFRKNGRPA